MLVIFHHNPPVNNRFFVAEMTIHCTFVEILQPVCASKGWAETDWRFFLRDNVPLPKLLTPADLDDTLDDTMDDN